MAVPPLVLIALSSVWFWMSRVERSAKAIRVEPFMPPSIDSLTRELDQHAAAGDARSFLGAARNALCRVLASKWGLTLPEVTTEEVASRLGAESEVSRAFTLADEAAYSDLKLTPLDFRQWKQAVLRTVGEGTPS